MTGTRMLIIMLACTLAATACGGGDTGTLPVGETTDAAGASPPPSEVTEEPTSEATRPTAQPLPTAAPTPTDDKSSLAAPDEAGTTGETGDDGPTTRSRPDTSQIPDLSSVALELERPDANFDPETVIIDENFDTTTPVLPVFDDVDGSGGLGHFGESTFYEMVLTAPDGHLAAPILRLDPDASRSVFLQQVSFITSFSGIASMDRGLYCWAADGNDPLSGARYELLYGPDGRYQVIRYGPDGEPAALLIDRTHDVAGGLAADPDAPGSPLSASRIGMLCRPDSEGRAQIAVRVEREYVVTTDQDNHEPGGGAGVVVAGTGRPSTDTIATFGSLFVLDGDQVPLR